MHSFSRRARALPGQYSGGVGPVKSEAAGQIAAGAGQAFTISCDPGQKIVSARFASDGPVLVAVASAPTSNQAWTMGLLNTSDTTPAIVTMFATCLK